MWFYAYTNAVVELYQNMLLLLLQVNCIAHVRSCAAKTAIQSVSHVGLLSE